ncbi:MAG: hypothetical protein KatS3mg111_2635 [Pirellulaceae bacterium]|nr:MAG: hypothetical protein KatS3mg111_2635 [Pirellulaceae bacterium]
MPILPRQTGGSSRWETDREAGRGGRQESGEGLAGGRAGRILHWQIAGAATELGNVGFAIEDKYAAGFFGRM